MRAYIGLAIAGALAIATSYWFGAIGVTRLFGLLFLCGCLFGCVAPAFTISAGKMEVVRLVGWWKAIALVPLSAVGFALVLYAPAITCISAKYKHLC